MKKTIYIDCTDLILMEIDTGIPRVARNLINNRFSAEKKFDVKIQPVFFTNRNGFIKVTGCSKNDLRNSIGYFFNVRLYLSEFWRFKRLLKVTFPFSIFHSFLDSIWGGSLKYLLLFPLFLLILPIVITTLFYTAIIQVKNIWIPNEYDIFIIPGSSWWNNCIHNGIKMIKRNDGYVVTVIFDIFPLTHPQFFSESILNNYTSNFPFIALNTDLFVTISKTTGNEIEKYLLNNFNCLELPSVDYFFLGANFSHSKPISNIREFIVTMFSDNQQYLCVGTVEPRKNYLFLLDTLEEIWKTNREIQLCIIGRNGWKSEKLVERIKNHPLFMKNLTWLNDINDTELSFCYSKSKALIFPSITEGFGLPLIEALHHGCPVIASDIPVFREIGGDHCAYFSLDSPNNLIALINEFETSGKLPGVQPAHDFKWISWEDSALEFYDKILKYFNKNENSLTH